VGHRSNRRLIKKRETEGGGKKRGRGTNNPIAEKEDRGTGKQMSSDQSIPKKIHGQKKQYLNGFFP